MLIFVKGEDGDLSKGVLLFYPGGENMGTKSFATEIQFQCDPNQEIGSAQFSSQKETDQHIVMEFQWRTKHACPARAVARPIPGLGIGGLVLIMLVFVRIQ